MSQIDLVGQHLGKYEIRTEIGRGGMGVVYLGYDPALDRQVAIKVLPPHLVWEKHFVERFLREARAAARLKHPHIVTIFDVGQDKGQYYFVMEFLEGQTLAAMVRDRGALPPDEVLTILRPLAEALDYAHSQGLVHRDLKPSNIVVEPTGRVVLTDFGIARAAQETALTRTGTLVGTPQYMSPEQARGEEVDHRTDIYSLGVVAYQMLSGRVPFDGTTPHAVLHKQIYEPLLPICQVRPNLPPGIETVLAQTLAKDPGERYATATASVEALAEALAGEAEMSSPLVAPRPSSPAAVTREKRRSIPIPWLLAGAAGLVLLLVVALGLAALSGNGAASGQPTAVPGTGNLAAEPTVTLRATGEEPTATPRAQPSATPPAAPPASLVLYQVESGDGTSLYATDLDGSGPYLLASGADYVSGRPSPDGQRVIVQLERDDLYSIYLMNADGSDRQVLASDLGYAWANFSRDGRRVYLTRREDRQVGDSTLRYYDLVVMDADGANPITLVSQTPSMSHSWTDDGELLALSVKRGDEYTLYTTRRDGSEQTTLKRGASSTHLPRLSGDGQWLAYRTRVDEAEDLALARSDGSQPTQLFDQVYYTSVTFAPSSKKVLVQVRETQDSAYDLYIVDTATGQRLRLLGGERLRAPGFSPDEEWIVASVLDEGFYRVYLVSADGAQKREIVGAGEGADRLAVGYLSPDGERLLVRLSRKESRAHDLYVMDTGGGQRVELARSADWAVTAAFTSDGRHIVYDSNRDGGRDVYVAGADGSNTRKLAEGIEPVVASGQPPRMLMPPPLPAPTPTPSPTTEASE